MKQTTRIVERKLRGPKLCGLCHPNGLIEIDSRLLPKDFLDTLLHELLHREFPDLSEEAVIRVAPRMTEALWSKNFRRIAQ